LKNVEVLLPTNKEWQSTQASESMTSKLKQHKHETNKPTQATDRMTSEPTNHKGDKQANTTQE
jgi:hypothetical protein